MYLYVDSAQTSEPWCCFCIRASWCGVQCTEYCFSAIGRSKERNRKWHLWSSSLVLRSSTLISEFSALCFVFCLEKEGCLHSSAGGGKHKTFHQEAYAGKDRNTWIHAASDTGGLWPGQQEIRINIVQLLLAHAGSAFALSSWASLSLSVVKRGKGIWGLSHLLFFHMVCFCYQLHAGAATCCPTGPSPGPAERCDCYG